MALPDCMMPDGGEPCRGYRETNEARMSLADECFALKVDLRANLKAQQNAAAEITRLRAELAAAVANKDGAYEERNRVVAALARLFPAGLTRTDIPGWDVEWHGCVYIDLPTGQVSWHFHDSQAHLFGGLPHYAGEWDGHDTPEKYRRLAALTCDPAGAELAEAQKSADIDRIRAEEAENIAAEAKARAEELAQWVIAFGAPWAARYGEDHFGPRMMHPQHYDILKSCGARMDDFTRAALREPKP